MSKHPGHHGLQADHHGHIATNENARCVTRPGTQVGSK